MDLAYFFIQYRDSLSIELKHYGGNSLCTTLTKPLCSAERNDIAAVALAIRHGMLELRDPEVLRERVSAAQSTGAAYANRGLARRFNLPRGKANVNATTKSVPIVCFVLKNYPFLHYFLIPTRTFNFFLF